MAYEVHLSQFEGPLDLLLHLIEQAKVDIKDIFISEITAQYLALMGEVDELDMDTASEFLIMAATLVYIKSRSLLPRPPREDPEGEKDPEARAYTRLPEEFVLPPQEYSLEQATSVELYEAFFAVLNRETPEPAVPSPLHQVKGDIFTIRRQLKKIRSVLSAQGRVTFEALFDEASEKLEKIVTFMALLDMIMRNEITLRQSMPYGTITIIAASLLSNDDDVEYMDEQE